MTLRIMLVGLVASLGFELPSGPDVSCWARSGRDWVIARAADLSGPEVEADRPDTGPADCHQAEPTISIERSVVEVDRPAPDDVAFAAASEAMAAEFAADLMSMNEERLPTEDAPALLADATPPIGLPDGEEFSLPPSPAAEEGPVDVAVTVAAEDDAPAESTVETEESCTRADRASSAIRLTREAVQAWAGLILESAEEADTTR